MNDLFFFLAGSAFGWITNHWYSVEMRKPSLKQNGGGSVSFSNLKFSGVSVGINNELRSLSISLPETVILGIRIPTYFAGRSIPRETAVECYATLSDESGRHICYLWWKDNNKIFEKVEIESGKSMSLVMFVRDKNDNHKYFSYQPTSSSDLNPKIEGVAVFDKTMSFLVRINYSYGSQSLTFPVKVFISYDGIIRFETNHSGQPF